MHRYISHLAILMIGSLFVLSPSLFGQTVPDLERLYENEQFMTLKNYRDENRISDPQWQMFIDALYMEDADSALEMFAAIYYNNQNKTLKKYIIQRVSDYYYARGYYKTADRLLKDKKYFNKIISQPQQSETSEENFGIQIGAFSNYANANSMKNRWMKKIKNLTIVNKQASGEDLYVVIAGKHSTREAAEKELQALKQNHNINGFVVEY